MSKFLICMAMAFSVFGILIALKPRPLKTVTYVLGSPQTEVPIKAIYQEPPSVSKIKHDLAGKTVVINGNAHKFLGPEINKLSIISSSPSVDDNIILEVEICADVIVIRRVGLLRSNRYQENVCGNLKISYFKKNDDWVFAGVDNIDMKKEIKLPSRTVRFWRYE
jgi:hypothetical protein